MPQEQKRDRLYRILEYTRHRLAEMNAVIGRIQSVVGTFLGFSITVLTLIFAIGVDDIIILIILLLTVFLMLSFSVWILRIPMVTKLHTINLDPTPWFYRNVITFNPSNPEQYELIDFTTDMQNYIGLMELNDNDWVDKTASQVLQLLMTTSIRMHQIERMNKWFKYMIIASVIVPIIGFIIRAILIIYFPYPFPPPITNEINV